MRIKKRLQVNVVVSVTMVFAICLMLFFSLHLLNRANDLGKMAGEVMTSILERVTFRDDYIRNDIRRAREQWFSKHEQIRILLKSASENFPDAEDKKNIREMMEDNESVGKIFSTIVSNRERRDLKPRPDMLSLEAEERLLSQLNMRTYEQVLHGRRLLDASRRIRASSITWAGGGIFSILMILIATVAITSWTMSRAVVDRVTRLREGALVIGEGKLDHRIDIKGDDEFAELSTAFNAMAAKLGGSYQGLEDEIGERKRVEDVLRQGRIDLDRAQEVGQIGSWRLDVHHNILTWSDENYRIFGLHRETPLNYETFLRIVHPDDRQYVDTKWEAGLCGEAYDIEHRIVVGGQVKWVREKAYLELDDTGVLLGGFGITQDITQRKLIEEELRKSRDELDLRVRERTSQLQQAYQKLLEETEERQRIEGQLRQAQKMEAIGTLAGGIAHDFNNILAGIIGFTEMTLEDVPKGSLMERNLERVLQAGFRGRDLVSKILAFSRKSQAQRSPVAVAPIIEETFKLLRASMPTTIDIRVDLKSQPIVMTDASELQQILMNLGTNAFHAMRETGGTLTISLTEATLDGEEPLPDVEMAYGTYAILTVTDTGYGMDEGTRKRIFEPFFTTKETGQGTGLGLAVVYGIVKSLNGGIFVESEPGKGTTFFVYLPVERKEPRADDDTIDFSGGNERILFIDDEELLVEAGAQRLSKLGYAVTTATDSKEAFRIFSDNPGAFDIVITDYTMPGLTGLALATKILRIRSDIPVILCTGYSETISPEKAKEAGIDEFLFKPIDKKLLAVRVRELLDRKTGIS